MTNLFAIIICFLVLFLQSAVHAFSIPNHERYFSQFVCHNALHLFSSTSNLEVDFSTFQRDAQDTLTKEELISRISAVQKYYEQNPSNLSKIDICLRLLCTRFPNLLLNRCFVSNSTIPSAGYGVFASRDINEGELITLYPGDAVLIDNHKEGSEAIMGVMFGDHIKQEDRDFSRVTTHSARNYEIGINDSTSIIGDPTIGCSYAAYLGHFINDAEALFSFDNESRKKYLMESLRRYNSKIFVMESSHVGAVATRSIRKGEEIFLSYGEGYWLSRLGHNLTPDKEQILKKLQASIKKQYNSSAGNSSLSSASTVELIEKPSIATKGIKKKSKRSPQKGFRRDV